MIINRNNLVNKKMNDIENLFDQFFYKLNHVQPFYDILHDDHCQIKIDIKETKNTYVVVAEVPGLQKDQVSIDYMNKYLILKVEEVKEIEDREDTYHIQECTVFSKSSRSIYLAKEVDPNKIEAQMCDGLLTIILYKTDESPKISIDIK